LPPDPDATGEELPPRDNVGCIFAMARIGCGMVILQVLMFLAIVFAALVSLLFFR
jgi:hypothetical protein